MTILFRFINYKYCAIKHNVILFQKISTKCSIKDKCCELPRAPWNILFFGSDKFSLESLIKLHQNYRNENLIRCLEVVTLSSKNSNSIYKYAKENDLKIHEWPYKSSKHKFDIGLVISFGRLIPEDVIQSFPLGMINVHASLLPRWRGAAPITYALMNGDTITGISIMKIMPKKFDIGDIILQREVAIHKNETYPKLHEKLAKCGADVIMNVLSEIPHILYKAKPQKEENVTYAPKITQQISYVKWDKMSAEDVYNLYRAIYGFYDLRTVFNETVIKLLDISLFEDSKNTHNDEGETPGLITYNKKQKILLVNCKNNGKIRVERIIFPNKPALNAKNFYDGYLQQKKENKHYFKSYSLFIVTPLWISN